MTLTSTTNKVQYNGDGSTTAFPVTFVFWDNADIKAILKDANGVETTWVLGTQYTLSGGDGATGTLTVETSPTDYTPASGETLTIKSNLTDTQDLSLAVGGPLPTATIEERLDKNVRLIQQKDEEIDRKIGFSETSTASPGSVPDPVSAIRLIGYAADDTFALFATVDLSNTTVTNYATTLLDDADAGTARTTLGLGTFAVENVAAVPAMTYAATQSYADNIISRPKIEDYGETVNAIGSIGGGTQDIDLESGNVVTGTVDTSTTTFTFSNPPASGTAGSFTLILTNGGSQTVNWPASVDWAGGTAPTLTTSGVDVLTFTTVDGGTIWYGFAAGLDMQ